MPARITGAIRRDETIQRLGGNGDNWHMTWAGDDLQYVSMCDGYGWPGMPGFDQVDGEFNSRLYAIHGTPPGEVRFEYLPGYPDFRSSLAPGTLRPTNDRCPYYSFGTVQVEGTIYQFLSTLDHRGHHPDGSPWSPVNFIGAKLIYSEDGARTWRNQDGSDPVVWEGWEERDHDNMPFLFEEDGTFGLLTVLQMGKDYAANRDGFVYIYAPNGLVDGTMNELVLCRVPKGSILDRSSYEFFAGGGTWSADIAHRVPVHTFPPGWVNTNAHPYAWHPSVVYVEALGTYLMANWGMGVNEAGEWFGKPSYLGLYTAPAPEGPWTQIHEETEWTPEGNAGARCYQPQIAPAWVAADGSSFWLVWTDFMPGDGGSEQRLTAENKIAWLPYYAFNVQRVDLTLE
jgi:hypothetical protein